MSDCAMSRKPAKSLTVFSRKPARVSTEKSDGHHVSDRGPTWPEARAEKDGHRRQQSRSQEEPEVRAQEVVDDPARVRSQSHAYGAHAHGDPVHEGDRAHAGSRPSHRLLQRPEEHGEGEEGADGHGDDDEGGAEHHPSVVGALGYESSILPSRTGMRKHRFMAITMPSIAQGTANPPRRCTARPNRGGHRLTPNDEMVSPRPTAVPAPRGPTSSASRVCCTPFQPMPKKPKATVSGPRSHAPVLGPVSAMASEQAVEPAPAMTSTTRRRPWK